MAPAMDYDRVADLYDVYVRFERDIPFFLQECRQSQGPVLELMAGTGRLSLPLAEAGIALTCVDSSGEMLGLMQKKFTARHLAVTTIQQDVCELDVPQSYPLVILPFHAFAEISSAADQQRALQAIFRSVAPGGRFICALHNPVIRRQSIDGRSQTVGRFALDNREGEAVVRIKTTLDDVTGVVRGEQTIEVVGQGDEVVDRRIMPIEFTLIAPEAFEGMALAAGFRVAAVFGDYDRSPFLQKSSPFAIYALDKPE